MRRRHGRADRTAARVPGREPGRRARDAGHHRTRWIGNGSIADAVVFWARSDEDRQVKGFLVETDTPGFEAVTFTGKAAARAIWQAEITLDGVRVPESSWLPGAEPSRTPAACWSPRAVCAPGARSVTPSPLTTPP